jgi:transposase
VEDDGLSYASAADTFRVGEASVSRYLRRAREGQLEPTKAVRTSPVLIDAQRLEVLRALVLERQDATVAELVVLFEERTGISVSRSTLGRAIREAGFSRKKRL